MQLCERRKGLQLRGTGGGARFGLARVELPPAAAPRERSEIVPSPMPTERRLPDAGAAAKLVAVAAPGDMVVSGAVEGLADRAPPKTMLRGALCATLGSDIEVEDMVWATLRPRIEVWLGERLRSRRDELGDGARRDELVDAADGDSARLLTELKRVTGAAAAAALGEPAGDCCCESMLRSDMVESTRVRPRTSPGTDSERGGASCTSTATASGVE